MNEKSGIMNESEAKEAVVQRPRTEHKFGLGERLYHQALAKKSSLAKIISENQKMKEKKEIEGLTFRPKINKSSKKQANSQQEKRPEERLLNHLIISKEKQEKMQCIKQSEEKKKYTFSPTINQKYIL